MNKKNRTVVDVLATIQTRKLAELSLADAQRILVEKAGDRDGEYANRRYVKMAAGIAYRGVLSAVDGYLKSKEGVQFIKPKDIEEYRIRVAKQNHKLLWLLNAVYGELYISGGVVGFWRTVALLVFRDIIKLKLSWTPVADT